MEQPYWNRDPADVQASLAAAPGGLTSAEADKRLGVYGPNEIDDTQQASALHLLLRQFESPLVLILIFGAAVSLTLRQWVDAATILTIVVVSASLGFYQEYRATAAIAALRRRLALSCQIIRDGIEQTMPAAAVVPGDVVVLSAGKLVPADGLILEARDFLVNEASLTGESFPVEKQPGAVAADAPVANRTNSVFLGTSVQSGMAKVMIVETGQRTAFGKVAARIRQRRTGSDFERAIRQFGYLLVQVMVPIVLGVLTINLLLGRPLIESLLFAVALAVGLSPELLPAIVTVTLAAGARAMAAQGVIIRRLDAVENLGSIDILCTDKTGTLTEGTITLAGAVDASGVPSPGVASLAFLNASFETGIENPLDAAIMASGKATGIAVDGFRKIDEIPYDFLRKRLTIVLARPDDEAHHQIIIKGAFQNVLEICSTVGGEPLDAAKRQRLDDYFQAKSSEGFRVLAVATRVGDAQPRYGRADEAAMDFAGFLLFLDPPKAGAPEIVRDLRQLGIHIKVISGDNRFVTRHLAEAVGLDPDSILTGADLEKMKDQALWHLAPETDLFVEVDPQQKERIVRALQRTGHAVGYLGDGINDVPALHAADVGISVDQAVDVARESADIILMERDLDVLRSGVANGRRTVANTIKYICITTSANFGNMISMAFAAPFLPFLPLIAKQILLNNFLSDLPSMAISSDNVDEAVVRTVERWNIGEIRRFMIVFGAISSVFDLITFALLLLVFHAGEAAFQTSWFVISLLTELGVVLVLRTRAPALSSRPSAVLLWTTAVASVAALALPFVGPISEAFSFVPLSAAEMGTALVIVIGYLLATEMVKVRFFRGRD